MKDACVHDYVATIVLADVSLQDQADVVVALVAQTEHHIVGVGEEGAGKLEDATPHQAESFGAILQN